MMSFVREAGGPGAIKQIAKWLKEADMLCGGRTEDTVIVMIANMIVGQFRHRSVASVLMALKEGISYTDDDARVYGYLTWPKVAIWLHRHEEQVLALAHDGHASKVVKGDNYDHRWMESLEDRSKGVTDRQSREIDRLRKQLDVKYIKPK